MLLERGASWMTMPSFHSSYPCSQCRDMLYLSAAVSGQHLDDPRCLTCALQHSDAARQRGGDDDGGGGCVVLLREEVPMLEALARSFEAQLPLSCAAACETGRPRIARAVERLEPGCCELSGQSIVWQHGDACTSPTLIMPVCPKVLLCLHFMGIAGRLD